LDVTKRPRAKAAGASGREVTEEDSTLEADLEANCDEDVDLISTLQAGLNVLGYSEPADHDSAESPNEHRPFHLHGRVVSLPVSAEDSLTYRVEALKVYLEQEIGLDAFLCLYRYLNASVQKESEFLGKQESLESMVEARAIEYLPLVHQLIVCEDACFSH